MGDEPRRRLDPTAVAVIVAAALAAGAEAGVLAAPTRALPWFVPVGAAVAIAAGLLPLVLAAPTRAQALRATALSAAVMAGGVWVSLVLLLGWSAWLVAALVCGAIIGSVLARRLPAVPARASHGPAASPMPPQPGQDRRPLAIQRWEALLRRLSREPVIVRDVVPWDDPRNGVRVKIDLPEGYEPRDFAAVCPKVESSPSLRLPPGCNAQLRPGDVQCEVYLDVMLRNSFVETIACAEPPTPARFTDPLVMMYAPTGEPMALELRRNSVVVGGAPDSGKTTWLHRLIMWLARCTDVLIWVVDMNGGGVAEPWIRAWLDGRADKPVIDWVAWNEPEAAVLVTTANAIVKDRKTSPEAVRRRRQASSSILPLDDQMPAIVVITDEGAEVAQALGILGQVAAAGLSRLAQIGRESGGRAIMSVLRGTGDLLDKSFRTMAAIRVCLRMNEEGEADHILGVNPGRTRIVNSGVAWLYRQQDYRPVLVKAELVTPAEIEDQALACQHHRPDLDDRARMIAARVTVRDCLGGRNPKDFRELTRFRAFQDVATGRGYEDRWQRYLAKDDHEDVDSPASEGGSQLTGAMADFVASVGGQAPAAAVSRPATAREGIIQIVQDAGGEPIQSKEIGERLHAMGLGVARTRRAELLTELVRSGEIAAAGGSGDGLYRDPKGSQPPRPANATSDDEAEAA